MVKLIWFVTQTYCKLYTRLFIDKDWQCLEVSEKASHFLVLGMVSCMGHEPASISPLVN